MEKEKEFVYEVEKAVKKGSISNKERRHIKEILKKYRAYFCQKISIEQATKSIIPDKIRLKEDAIPVIEAMGRVNPERHDVIDKVVYDLAERGLIEQGNGAWRSRVLLVKKKDGSWRTTIDYRRLNAQTILTAIHYQGLTTCWTCLRGQNIFRSWI